MTTGMLLVALFTLAIVFIARLAWLLRLRDDGATPAPGPVIVVLGSGGHTSEMLRWLAIARPTRPVVFVVAATDNHSARAAQAYDPAARVVVIPRAREVGQSYATSVLTTLRAVAASITVAYRVAPAAIAVNGPGVCVPIVVADAIVAALLPLSRRRRAALLYVESFACVEHLSMSGKILAPIADRFVVQWPELLRHCQQRATFQPQPTAPPQPPPPPPPPLSRLSRLQYTGPFPLSPEPTQGSASPAVVAGPCRDGAHFRGLFEAGSRRRRLCVVTVGSTRFDSLIRVVCTARFEAAIARLGIDELLVQRGASAAVPACDDGTAGSGDAKSQAPPLRCTTVDYKHGLGADIADAALVISHAGAGTILEALAARAATVVVPNTALMSNHQAEIANGLASRGHLLCAEPEMLLMLLESRDVDWQGFVPLPPPDAAGFAAATFPFFHE